METIVLVVHVLLAITVIGLVLIQHGKGANAGAAFGSGASATVFGARGSGSFLTKATTLAVAMFFLTSIALFVFASQRPSELGSVTDALPANVEESIAIPDEETEAPAIADDVPQVEE